MNTRILERDGAPVTGAPRSLVELAERPYWVAWREEERESQNGEIKTTKIPYDPRLGRKARIPTDPSTWNTFERAERRASSLDDGRPVGTGIVLGDHFENELCLIGIDLDGCILDGRRIDRIAKDVISRFASYAEVSPSRNGIKCFFWISSFDYTNARQLIGGKLRKSFVVAEHKEIALDLGRYYTVTGDNLRSYQSLRVVTFEDIRWLLEDAGPQFLQRHRPSNISDGRNSARDESGSGWGFRFMQDYKRRRLTFDQARAAILADRGPAGEWARRSDSRQLERVWGNAAARSASETLDVVKVADVEMTEVSWIWPLRLARGKMTIVAGDPGLGKSQVAIDVAARITRGGRWPDGDHAPQGSVVILAAEDAVGDTIRPRLEAAGANVARVHVVKMVNTGEGHSRTFNLATDLAMLERLIQQIGDVVCVIIDPISSYMGDTDSHKLTAVSPVFSQVADFAERNDIGTLAVHHPPKQNSGKALHAFSGSLAFVSGPRLAFVVVDEAEKNRKLLLPVKTNLGPPAPGIGYRIAEASVDHRFLTSVISWDDEPVTVSANEAIRAANGSDGPSKLEQAKELLRELLADGPKPQTEIGEAARTRDIGASTLKNAKAGLNIVSRRSGFAGGWVWQLPTARSQRGAASRRG